MWFKVLSLLLGSAFLIKGIIASAIPDRFYGVRRAHYASEKIPAKVLVASVYVAIAFAAVWYATLFRYAAWGWIVTAIISAIFLLSVHQILNWPGHRARMSELLRQPRSLRRIDLLLVGAGAALLLLGCCVY